MGRIHCCRLLKPTRINPLANRGRAIHSVHTAVEACADAGNIEKAIEIALDVEQPVYEVTTFLNAASLMNRVCKT